MDTNNIARDLCPQPIHMMMAGMTLSHVVAVSGRLEFLYKLLPWRSQLLASLHPVS